MLQIDNSDAVPSQRFSKASRTHTMQKTFSAKEKPTNPISQRRPSRKSDSRGKVILAPLENVDVSSTKPGSEAPSPKGRAMSGNLDEYITKVSSNKYDNGLRPKKLNSHSVNQSPVKGQQKKMVVYGV